MVSAVGGKYREDEEKEDSESNGLAKLRPGGMRPEVAYIFHVTQIFGASPFTVQDGNVHFSW